MLSWLAVGVEFLGLSLIATELYFPDASERLKRVFEIVRPTRTVGAGRRRYGLWVGGYVVVWIVLVSGLSIWDASAGLVANIAFSIFTVILLSVVAMVRFFVGLGVLLGRGNSVGGVGLVLAMIGFSLEISQLLV